MNAAGFDPLEPYANAVTKWKCRCTTCGETVFPTLSGVTAGNGCRNCARSGFNPIAPQSCTSSHTKSGTQQRSASPVPKFKRNASQNIHETGWTVVGLWNVDYGGHAETVEDQVLDWWRTELSALQAITDNRMPQHAKQKQRH